MSTLHVGCPKCASSMVFETPINNRLFDGISFDRGNCPPQIAGDLHGATQQCRYCGAEVTLVVTCLINTYHVDSKE